MDLAEIEAEYRAAADPLSAALLEDRITYATFKARHAEICAQYRRQLYDLQKTAGLCTFSERDYETGDLFTCRATPAP